MYRSTATIISCNNHSLCLSNDGTVFSFGSSEWGENGHEEEKVFPPRIISSLTNIKSISGSIAHSVCLDYDGNVFTFGNNYFGRLGIGVDEDTLEYTHIPQKVNLPSCKEISCGNDFTMCLSNDDLIYCFGNNENEQLGIGGNDKMYNSPQLLPSLKDVEFIECGHNFTFCKTKNNSIYCWGNNYYGQLGIENNDNQNTPILCSSLSNEDIIDIKCGLYHTLVLTSNGDVLSCGHNYHGQFDRYVNFYYNYSPSFKKIEILPKITRIECGDCHSMCVDLNYNLFVFGKNTEGQLGLGDIESRYIPIKHPSLSNIIDISKRGNHTFVKTFDDKIYAFGYNQYSQLEIETVTSKYQLTPIRVFEDNEDIWYSNINNSKVKSARSILPRQSNEEDNSPPKKKQKTKCRR